MFTVFSKPDCPHCEQAKTLLESREMQFKTVHLDVGQLRAPMMNFITREELLARFPGTRTMPLILDDGVKVGGLAELKTYLRSLEPVDPYEGLGDQRCV